MKRPSNHAKEELKDPPKEDGSLSSSENEEDKKIKSTDTSRNRDDTSTSRILKNNTANEKSNKTNETGQTEGAISVEVLVDILSKDADLVSMVEVRLN